MSVAAEQATPEQQRRPAWTGGYDEALVPVFGNDAYLDNLGAVEKTGHLTRIQSTTVISGILAVRGAFLNNTISEFLSRVRYTNGKSELTLDQNGTDPRAQADTTTPEERIWRQRYYGPSAEQASYNGLPLERPTKVSFLLRRDTKAQ